MAGAGAVAGCVGEPQPAEEPGLAEPGAPPVITPIALVGEQEQGRYILGSAPDGLATSGGHVRYGVAASDAAHAGFRVALTRGAHGTHLVATNGVGTTYTGADAWFEGMVLPRSPLGAIRIVRSEPRATAHPQYPSTTYFLEHHTGNGLWAPYCGDPAMGAIAVAGAYDPRRIHRNVVAVSFACDDSAAAKCNDWGYPGGNSGPGDLMWERHQACTAMANADYCRSGTSYTREETPILLRDFDGSPYPYPDLPHPQPVPGNPDAYRFEAGWRGGEDGPVCLTKRRWETLPPNPCDAVLPDPRYSDHPKARFCEEMTYADIEAEGALLGNGSKKMDALLHTWRDPGTGDQVSTMRGYHSGAEVVAPFGGTYGDYVGVLGVVLRNLPGSLDEAADMHRLWIYEHVDTHERVLSIGAPTVKHVSTGFDSYSFRSATRVPGLGPLWRCQSATGFYNATSPCLGGVRLGYILSPP